MTMIAALRASEETLSAVDEKFVRSIPGFADPVSSLTHLAAAATFLVLAMYLLRRSRGRRGNEIALSIFAFAVVFMFSMSGVYHMLAHGSEGREVLHRLDHASIFLLIAGSLTAAHGILFRGWLCWGVIGFVWSFVAAAIPLRLVFFSETPEWLSMTLYLGLGWVGLLSTILVWHRYGWKFMIPLLAGGVAYTVGAIIDFVSWPDLIPQVMHAHDVWHVFVILGVAFHWRFCSSFADHTLPRPPMTFEAAVEEMHLKRK